MRPEHSVISGVNLEVGRGDVCALVGRSGGGKSTIVHLLMRFYDPTHGRILLDGWDLRDLNLKSVHKHMGLVAQETQMFAGSIEENIMYGLSSCNREDMEEAARWVILFMFVVKFLDSQESFHFVAFCAGSSTDVFCSLERSFLKMTFLLGI
jgi:ABC-type multidrug transport system fused ATPase/permease subunit